MTDASTRADAPQRPRLSLHVARALPDLPAGFADTLQLPVRVLQIGEGIFLRAFVDWIIHRMNLAGVFHGRVVMTAPRPTGAANLQRLRAQDHLFTVTVQGRRDGQVVQTRELVTSVADTVDAHAQWDRFLRLAEDPRVQVVVSNTTEMGIRYTPEAFDERRPAMSYPAKLTAWLYRRWRVLGDTEAAEVSILPCELVDGNGQVLREAVAQHARRWGLPNSFSDWLGRRAFFCNTLVDRIVTRPRQEDEEVGGLPYVDEMAVCAEPFHLWVIAGAPAWLKALWSFDRAGVNAAFVNDVAPYSLQKVRLLNGAHTAMAALGLLAGVRTVRDVMDHPLLEPCVRRLVHVEILPVVRSLVPVPAEAERFAEDVLERFRNPFLEHELRSIANGGLTKARHRLVPTLAGVSRSEPPRAIALAMAALLWLHHPAGPGRDIADDPETLARFQQLWRVEASEGLECAVFRILSSEPLWGCDLATIPGMVRTVTGMIQDLRSGGVPAAVRRWLPLAP